MSSVFVWVSYGNTDVYKADVKDDILRIVREINEVNDSLGEKEYDIEAVSLLIDAKGVDHVRRGLDRDVQGIVQASDDDRFSYGSGFAEVK